MNLEALFDPLFRVPFAAGLLVSLVLPLVGALLRLRDEWLAALGLAHLAGAGALVGLAAGIPTVLGTTIAATLGALIKNRGGLHGNSVDAVMILVGWSVTLLVAANTTLGSAMGHALVEGQLFFAAPAHLIAAFVLALLIAALLPRLMPALIRARLFPGFGVPDRRAGRHRDLVFDLLVALSVALGTAVVGLMAAFALIFLPAWLAFAVARSWRQTLLIVVAVGVIGYIAAFVAALLLDQPFGPVLVAVLTGVAVGRVLYRPERGSLG
ncbi:MAG: metal ABC transporter permease [Pseudomonadota bacterium]|nr:metal ABC transporter permease [Pseudomonadota bacterium]